MGDTTIVAGCCCAHREGHCAQCTGHGAHSGLNPDDVACGVGPSGLYSPSESTGRK